MPNQMIALQSRGANIPDPAAQTAKFVNMMNMAKQQEAAQRQSALAQQQMAYNTTQEARAVETQASTQKEASLTYLKNLTQHFKDRLATISPTDKARYGILRQEIIAAIPPFENELPLPDEWNKDTKFLTISKAADVIKYSRATPVTETIFGPDNKIYVAEKGGLNEGLRPLLNTPAAGASEGAPATPTAPATSTADAGVAMRATGGANTTPQDLISQGMNPNNIPSGMPTSRPISFNQSDMGGAGAGQMTPEVMSSIVDSAFQTGVMAQVDFDQLLATQPPENRQAFTDAFRRANITLQADAPSLADSGMGQQQSFAVNPVQTPQARFADMRGPAPQSQTAGLRGAPPMEQTLAQTNVLGGQAYGRSASPTSPLPGSSQVSLGRVAGEAAAQEGGKQGVRVKVEPAIAGATKTAELRAQKDAAFPDAQSQFEAAYTTVKNRLSDIKRFKEHPAATRVIGPIDAFTLNTGRARGAQEIYRTMVAAATFDALQEMRTNSPTGGALGNVSDADIRILKESIGALGQAQDEKDFFESLDIYEDRLNQVLGRLEKRFRGNYGYRLGSGWKPAEVATKRRTPTTGGRKAGAFTITEVDE
jgi:hypothetical protein